MDKKILDRVNRVIDAALRTAKTPLGTNAIEDMMVYTEGYAEPGYDVPECGIVVLGNWNSISMYDRELGKFVDIDTIPVRLATILERMGADTQWSDEWASCYDCGKLVRTKPNCYGWMQAYAENEDGDIQCLHCIDPLEHLERIEGDNRRCNTVHTINPADHGYVKLDQEFEHGLHPGQDADPGMIGAALRELGITRYLFNMDDVGQFDQTFSVWVHESEAELLPDKLTDSQVNGPSVSEAMKRGLKEAALQAGKLEGDGVRYSKINADGTVTTRLIGPEEFVEGVK